MRNSCKSLGFRGEALASIASISSLIIESKKSSETIGTRIYLREGQLEETSLLGMPSGTRLIIENLFNSVPARKKFLNSKRTEYHHIVETITQHSLALPHIHFHLSHDGKTILNLPSTQSFLSRILMLFPSIAADYLLPVSFSSQSLRIEGFICTPQLANQMNSKQYLTVNNRPVVDQLTKTAVKESYGILLPENIQPTFFLHISLPFEMVDVNVHPRKEEVSFLDKQFITKSITQSIKATLQSHDLTFHSANRQIYKTSPESITHSSLAKKLKEDVLPWNSTWLGENSFENALVQIHNLYIVAPSPGGLFVIDQHAAHERILYEKFSQQFFYQKENSQSTDLDYPILLALSLAESSILSSIRENLEGFGFQIDHFHGSTWKVTRAPQIFLDRNIKHLLLELLSATQSNSSSMMMDSESKKMLAFLACKTAVKAGDPLTRTQMKDIVIELSKIPQAFTCPHGRPVKWEISLSELNKLFKRK